MSSFFVGDNDGHPGALPDVQPFHSDAQQDPPQQGGFQQQLAESALPMQQPFQTGSLSHPQVAPQQTLSQNAQLLQSAPAATPQSSTTGTKLSEIWFLTDETRIRAEKIFEAEVGNGQFMSEGRAKYLWKLALPDLTNHDIQAIWVLADITKSGQLLWPEFAAAVYLCEHWSWGKGVPQSLPKHIADEISNKVKICNLPSVGGSAPLPNCGFRTIVPPMERFSTIYAFIRKSSADLSAAELRLKHNDQFEELREDFVNTYYPGGQCEMLFTLQVRSAREPIILPMEVREDLARNGTSGPVLLLLESCEGMSTDVEHWVKFRIEFPKPDIWIALAMQGEDKDLKTAPPGVWSDECSEMAQEKICYF